MRSATRFLAAALWARGMRRWDLVHGHALSPTVLGVALGRRRRAPPMLVKPSIGGSHGEGEVERIVRNPAAPILRRAAHRIDHFVVLDELIRNDMSRLEIPAARLTRIDNGIDTDRFRPAQGDERHCIRESLAIRADRVVLFCGQLTSRKGVMELLQAWRRVQAGHPDTVLVIAGDGPLKSKVETVAKQPDSGVVFLGQMSDVAPVIRMSDLLIMPSRFESFGNALVEALASGVPVLATHCGVAPRVLSGGDTGWIIDQTTPEAIEDALVTALAMSGQWDAMSRACRQVAEQFSFDKIARQYLQLYRKMLAGSR
jgi:glycosyltransferase involved in cell wall biosynthesis